MKKYKKYKQYKTRRNPVRMLAAVVAPLLVVAGLAIIGYTFLIGDPFGGSALFGGPAAPTNSTMTLTVPEMQRVREVPVYDGASNDEGALHDGTLHVRGTGFPWQQGSNVYIAGHRLGFPGTKSYLVFWDLDNLENGDEVILTDANGTRYTYQVFRTRVVGPTEYQVTQPVPGRSVVTLQTCTLPDYSERLIVQAELVSVA